MRGLRIEVLVRKVWMRLMSTIMATWLTTNKRIEDGVLMQRGLEEEHEYNHGYLDE